MDINQVNDQMMHYKFANSQLQASFKKTKFRPRK